MIVVMTFSSLIYALDGLVMHVNLLVIVLGFQGSSILSAKVS